MCICISKFLPQSVDFAMWRPLTLPSSSFMEQWLETVIWSWSIEMRSTRGTRLDTPKGLEVSDIPPYWSTTSSQLSMSSSVISTLVTLPQVRVDQWLESRLWSSSFQIMLEPQLLACLATNCAAPASSPWMSSTVHPTLFVFLRQRASND